MNIAIIGSSQFKDKMITHRDKLIAQKHTVKLPALDSLDLDALGVCKYNREMIEWADEVHIIWDRRSIGTIFDFGMVFALRKPIKIIYLEPKTLEGAMKGYEREINAQY